MTADEASRTVTTALVLECPDRAAVADGEDAPTPSIDQLRLGDVVEIKKRGRG